MAEERPVTPPLRKPISLTSTPVHTDSLYIEVLNKDDPTYVANAPIKRGSLYSTMKGADQSVIDAYPLLYFAQETQVGQSDQLVQWRWVTDPLAEDTYNAEVSYALESVTSPTYARTYTIRRDVYDNLDPIDMGTPLTGIIGVTILDGGQGYTYANGTIDTDATIEFVIGPDQTIISGIVTDEGSDVTSGGQITITGDGDLAEATAIIQPVSAVLIGQKKQEFPPDHPLNEEYVRVTRIYQTLPGPTIHSTQLHVDGVVVDVATTQKVASSITSGETLNAGTWTITTKVQEDNAYVGKEVVSTRDVPGNPIVTTTIDADGDTVTETRTVSEGPPTLVTTITTAGGVWTKTFAEAFSNRLTLGEEASDLVCWQVVQVKATQSVMDLYEAEIPDLVPEQFRPRLPVTTHEETLIGFASAITLPLAAGVLMERKAQIDYNTYRHTVRSRAFTERVQIINYEITSEFGGGRVAETITLDLFDNLTPIDGSLTILTSILRHIDDQSNGLAIQETRELDDSAWPILPSRLWDENTRQEYDETSQIIDTGTAEDPNPGVFGWVSEVKAKDKWKAQKVNISKDAPDYVDEASALITYDYRPYRFPGVMTIFSGALTFFYIRSSHADLVQQKIRTWWIQSTNPPTPPSVDEIIMDNPLVTALNSDDLTYAGECLHDAYSMLVHFWLPISYVDTTPSATTYVTSWVGTERIIAATVTAEREKDVWKIQTRSVVMQ